MVVITIIIVTVVIIIIYSVNVVRDNFFGMSDKGYKKLRRKLHVEKDFIYAVIYFIDGWVNDSPIKILSLTIHVMPSLRR